MALTSLNRIRPLADNLSILNNHDRDKNTIFPEDREGQFIPGETISIRGLAKEYGTSVMPAREAVRWLVAEGALEFTDSRKIIVPEGALEFTDSRKIIVPNLTNSRYFDILFLRKSLEGEISERAFPNISAKDIDTLKTIDGLIDRAIETNDLNLYMKNNYKFHFYIYKLGNSSIILHLIELLWLQYGPSMRFICSRWGDSTSDLDHHRSVTAALDRGDCPAFRASIEADIEQGIKLILQS